VLPSSILCNDAWSWLREERLVRWQFSRSQATNKFDGFTTVSNVLFEAPTDGAAGADVRERGSEAHCSHERDHKRHLSKGFAPFRLPLFRAFSEVPIKLPTSAAAGEETLPRRIGPQSRWLGLLGSRLETMRAC